MRKYFILSLVAVMSLVSLAPALATENEGRKGKGKEVAEMKKELRKEIKEEKKEMKEEKKEIKDRLKELEKAIRFVPKALTLVGKLVSVNTATSSTSTEITVNVTKVLPGRPKKMPTSTVAYPEAGKDIVLKVSDKTLLIRAYGAKMEVSEMSVGDELRIVAKFGKDGLLDVRVVKDNSLHALRNKKGIVESINASILSFVLKQDNRNLTVKTDEKTKFHMKGNTSTSFANLKVGDKVTVNGIVNINTKTVDANSVTLKKSVVISVPPPVVPTSTIPTPTSTPTTPTSTASST